jgi:putative oxidoreductase
MSHWMDTLTAVVPWAGLALLGLIFVANALGVLDQSVAVRELAATGLPEPAARVMVTLGRVLQLLATPCLFVVAARPYAAVALALFLIGATLTAHAFWRSPTSQRDRQLANFLKNAAMVGGLLLAAGWRA